MLMFDTDTQKRDKKVLSSNERRNWERSVMVSANENLHGKGRAGILKEGRFPTSNLRVRLPFQITQSSNISPAQNQYQKFKVMQPSSPYPILTNVPPFGRHSKVVVLPAESPSVCCSHHNYAVGWIVHHRIQYLKPS